MQKLFLFCPRLFFYFLATIFGKPLRWIRQNNLVPANPDPQHCVKVQQHHGGENAIICGFWHAGIITYHKVQHQMQCEDDMICCFGRLELHTHEKVRVHIKAINWYRLSWLWRRRGARLLYSLHTSSQDSKGSILVQVVPKSTLRSIFVWIKSV